MGPFPQLFLSALDPGYTGNLLLLVGDTIFALTPSQPLWVLLHKAVFYSTNPIMSKCECSHSHWHLHYSFFNVWYNKKICFYMPWCFGIEFMNVTLITLSHRLGRSLFESLLFLTNGNLKPLLQQRDFTDQICDGIGESFLRTVISSGL